MPKRLNDAGACVLSGRCGAAIADLEASLGVLRQRGRAVSPAAGPVVEARLGVAPRDVLHQGLARVTGLTMGTYLIVVSGAVLLLWVPLRQRPGVGTVSNTVLVGVVLDATLRALPTVTRLPLQLAALLAGVA